MTLLPDLQRAFLRGEAVDGLAMLVPPPIARLIGFHPTAIEAGATVFRLAVHRDKHINPMGTLHGGILCDLADGAMGIACATLIERGESFTTLELKINFLRPVWEGVLEARARVVNRGRSLHYVECDIMTIPEEKLVAKTSCTCLILRGDQARGR